MLTIIEKAASKALTTTVAVEAELGSFDANERGLVEEMILRASATVETLCGRTFALERVRETSASVLRQGGSLTLSRWPIAEIHSVTANGSALGDDAYALDHGILSGAFGRVAVEYSAGYVLPGVEGRDLPYDIERVVIELVKLDWLSRGRDASIRSEDVDGVSSIAFFGAGSTMSAVTAPLAAYRVPVAL
ncbi:hypothetical protein [Aureimonas sp. AU12]|uniref:hypothetical protein n=1 Tax=Aureimonas sp. AU12 TaxID=1638161 RepID=UPI0007814CBE|nr:hypothetical protein [Aureimonas sp. AU12]